MALLKATAVWLAWVGAHAVAGLLFLVVISTIPIDYSIPVTLLHGLAAGVLFGFAQWLVLRWCLPRVRWWLPATIAASPASWFLGIWLAVATLTFGGWLGGLVSASLQTALLARALLDQNRSPALSVLWLPAALAGSLFFYYGYLFAASGGRFLPPRWESILGGSVAYAALTGLVVALLVGLAPARTNQPSDSGAVVSRM